MLRESHGSPQDSNGIFTFNSRLKTSVLNTDLLHKWQEQNTAAWPGYHGEDSSCRKLRSKNEAVAGEGALMLMSHWRNPEWLRGRGQSAKDDPHEPDRQEEGWQQGLLAAVRQVTVLGYQPSASFSVKWHTKISYTVGSLWGRSELMYREHWEHCLAHSKDSENVTISIFQPRLAFPLSAKSWDSPWMWRGHCLWSVAETYFGCDLNYGQGQN